MSIVTDRFWTFHHITNPTLFVQYVSLVTFHIGKPPVTHFCAIIAICNVWPFFNLSSYYTSNLICVIDAICDLYRTFPYFWNPSMILQHICHLWLLSNFPFLKSIPNSTTYLPFCDLFSNSPAFDLLGGSCKVFDSHLHINDGLYQCFYIDTKQWNKKMVNVLKLVLLASAVGGSSIRWLWASSSLLPGSRSR